MKDAIISKFFLDKEQKSKLYFDKVSHQTMYFINLVSLYGSSDFSKQKIVRKYFLWQSNEFPKLQIFKKWEKEFSHDNDLTWIECWNKYDSIILDYKKQMETLANELSLEFELDSDENPFKLIK